MKKIEEQQQMQAQMKMMMSMRGGMKGGMMVMQMPRGGMMGGGMGGRGGMGGGYGMQVCSLTQIFIFLLFHNSDSSDFGTKQSTTLHSMMNAKC